MAALTAAAAVGQLAILQRGVHPLTFPDSREYLALAAAGHGFGSFFDTKRTPGYPVFLGIIELAHGGPGTVVAVQVMVVLLTTAMAFVVASRLGNPVVAATAAAALVGANPWVTQWEQALLAEAPATLLLLLVAWSWIKLAARPGLRRAALVGALCALLVVVRPAFVPVATALAVAGLTFSVARRDRHLALATLVMLLAAYAPVVGYVAGNALGHGYAGISTTSNVDVFGVAYLDFGLVPAAAPGPCAALAPLARSEHGEDPYAFLGRHPKFASPGQAVLRDCGVMAIRAAPLAFLEHVATRVVTLPFEGPVFYYDNPHVDTEPFKRPVALFKVFHAWIVASYVVVAGGLAVQLGRRSASLATFGLVAAVAGQLVTVAALGPTELYRLRSPLDPLVTILAITFCWTAFNAFPGKRVSVAPQRQAEID